MSNFNLLAIANRGEAAMRCIRTAKNLRTKEGSSLETLALYTNADREAPFVRHAHRAISLDESNGPVAAYLDYKGLVSVMRGAGVDAVWPGWGFVAESPGFVDELESAGIIFLGPPASAMRRLGDKISSKLLAESLSVPVTPWSRRAMDNIVEARDSAREIGFPLVVKASAGGGGRGIRFVSNEEDLEDAFNSAKSEAESAFGDGRLFLESAVQGGRHIEVQVLADKFGNTFSLGCRDCSVQRRFQKVLEESPPPNLSQDLMETLQHDAIRIASEVGYESAGTVEFLVGPEEYYFLEMNPRLQVEHGITEAVTGLDLVELQICVARNENLSGLKINSLGHAFEARVCAEDPDSGFLPAPGKIARFDPALGPRIRIDTGVSPGASVPEAFDSLIAKVITTGIDREDARARLLSALSDFDLVIEGGATNKGYLLGVLSDTEYIQGGVDVGWLDRRSEQRTGQGLHASPALIAAAVLAYQRDRKLARLNFYADPSNINPANVPKSEGQEIDLSYKGEQYRLDVFAIGSWRYRVYLDDQVVAVSLTEQGGHRAQLTLNGEELPILYDSTEAGIRVEVEGQPHQFGWQTLGQVRAATPAMVIAVNVAVGDRVEAGHPLGILEAMKMEIGFDAPVAGVVTELEVRAGQQVKAGDVLIVIDPAGDEDLSETSERLVLPAYEDPLAPLFRSNKEGGAFGLPDLSEADASAPEDRRSAVSAVREEIRRLILGFDVHPQRAESLIEFLESPLDASLSSQFISELAPAAIELRVAADVEQLFIRSPRASVSGELGPSNSARMRMFVRRLRAGGAGIASEFLELVSTALAHYGISNLEEDFDEIERAVLRMLASQVAPPQRQRIILALLRQVESLVQHGVVADRAWELEEALTRLADMRGLVSDAVADAAIDARYEIYERPGIDAGLERTGQDLDEWFSVGGRGVEQPSNHIIRDMADSPRPIFDRVARGISDVDENKRVLAIQVHLQRIYSPISIVDWKFSIHGKLSVVEATLEDERVVIASACLPDDISDSAALLKEAASRRREHHEWPAVFSIELLVSAEESFSITEAARRLQRCIKSGFSARRFTLSVVSMGKASQCETFLPTQSSCKKLDRAFGLHPECLSRIDLERLEKFDLKRMDAPEDIYAFKARALEAEGDERIIVLAEVRSRRDHPDRHEEVNPAAFEKAFIEATRVMRRLVAEIDPKRRLQWNRICIYCGPPVRLDSDLTSNMIRRLWPTARRLGLEKVIVRANLIDEKSSGPMRQTEFVISDITGSNIDLITRDPRRRPLESVSDYEQKVLTARSRRLVYPYEIIRMLTGSGRDSDSLTPFPTGAFEEYDLSEEREESEPLDCQSVDGRPYGLNKSAVVFGIITTPTEKHPEGIQRVLLLSDPTIGMGALSSGECDRIVVALKLAEDRKIPLEWIPVSAGAKIEMESGTENLDATARVVKKIIEFTQNGGSINLIIQGVNVGAQSYWNALSTMLMHTKGVLIMTPGASMVLTGRAALEASGAVSAEDEVAIGGFERIMGPNGEAQYFASDLSDAYRILYEYYRYSYVAPGEFMPRSSESTDQITRSLRHEPCDSEETAVFDFKFVGEIFEDETNPGRKKPFPMRSVMQALVDKDGGHLERWNAWVGAETSIIWDAHLGGIPATLIGIESHNLTREGYRPLDGPASWSGGTLFPQSSKKVARALNSASGNRPVVVLANLSGFDGSPESMRKLQLEYGAEIARAVVNFRGPLLFMVVSRYHGGAYVVFSQELNLSLKASALEGAYASVIGGGPAAAVVFAREVRARVAADERVRKMQLESEQSGKTQSRATLDKVRHEVTLEKQAELAEEFDRIHSVQRAQAVGSLGNIIPPDTLRPFLIGQLRQSIGLEEEG